MRKNLRFRFVVYFFIVMIAASLTASIIPYFYISRKMEQSLIINQEEIAETLMGLYEDENGNFIDSTSGTSYEVYSVNRLDSSSPMIRDYKDRLDAGEIIAKKDWLLPTVSTFFAVGGNYYMISLFPNSTVTWQVVSSLLAALLSTLAIGIIYASFAGKWFLRPIRALSKATEEVAKGNFDVEVPVPKNNELARLVNNFNQMTHDLGSTETLQREFISNVSHEFKTPLASIRGFADLLSQDGIPEEDRREYAAIISEESRRLSRLSSSILQLSKLENIDSLTDRREFSLDEQLRRIISTLEPQWRQKNLEMNIDLVPVTIIGNDTLLSEVWINLLTNAIKYTGDGGHIRVQLTEGLDNVTVEVEDDGIGMSDSVRERIFDKFYQGDRSHSGEGNGLGLSLAHRIVELSGGFIEVESIEGEGSLFRVSLPID